MKITSDKLKRFAFLNFGILLMSVGIYFFKNPNGFATGGVSGISIILHNVFPSITTATYMLVINALLIIIGLICLGRECGIWTVYCSLLMSFETWLFELILPIYVPLTEYPLLELVYAVLLTGIGSAIIFKCKASSGGTDIIALILKKHTSMNVGTALLCTDFIIAASTFFLTADGISFDAQTGLFSLLGLFAKVFVVDDIIDSINLCKSFTIITTRPDEIEEFIKREIKHSATTYEAQGSYSHEGRRVIMTVCRRSEAIRLRKKVYEIDPHAFMIITKTSEILGKGFRDNVN
ncbi:MAG: YitT family protein [Ruminococcaceae bacterium]|nr:YitT family protein [Oscillospiraceae bacterium]